MLQTRLLRQHVRQQGGCPGWVQIVTFLHCVILILTVSESPILSMVMTQNSSAECEMLASNQTEPGHTARRRSRRAAGEAEDGGNTADTADRSMPNIDFLLNPGKKEKREDYEGYVMKRLLSFFEERNSSMLYPDLFRYRVFV